VIPRRPIVQQHETENMLLSILNRHPLAPRHGLRDEISHLKLKIQTPGRAVRRLRINAVGEIHVRRTRDRAGRGEDG
jgi:hypothetical protein